MKKSIIFALGIIVALSSCKKTEQERTSGTTYEIIKEYSTIGWVGHKDSESNTGTFNVEGNGLTVSDGKIVSGSFTVPIVSLNVLNLQGELKTMLENHLKSADFFNLAIHPNAKFEITNISAYTGQLREGDVPGANQLVKGKFTLLGKTKEIEFKAKITVIGNALNVLANFKINRLDYGMNYASDSSVPAHYIYPEVDIVLAVAAKK